MKFSLVLAGVALLDATVSGTAIPDTTDLASLAFAPRDDASSSSFADLFKRKGGGGGGGKGGSGGSSSGGGKSGSSSSSTKGGSSSSSSTGKTGTSGSTSGSSSSGRGSSSSSTGGRTTTGSGAAASYGGGRFYGGGTTVPYRAGAVSTLGIAPLLFLGVGVTSLAFWPGLWYHPVYLYPYNHTWTYHNETTNANETKPVKCGCDAYQECGCDDNNSTDYVNSVLGTGAYNQLNQSLVTVAPVNGTNTILVNGTLPNGTTASGGSESPSAGVGMRRLAETAGWWPAAMAALAIALC